MTRGKKHRSETARSEARRRQNREWYHRNQPAVREQQSHYRMMVDSYYRRLKQSQQKLEGLLADRGISIVNAHELRNPSFRVNGKKERLFDE